MEGFLRTEVAVANMPRIRVQPKSTKRSKNEDMMGGFTISPPQNNYGRKFSNFLDGSARNIQDFTSLTGNKKSGKPRLNYDVLIAKAAKKVNGSDKEKIQRPKEYQPAKPDHIYESD